MAVSHLVLIELMLLANKENIREITLFPMNQNAQDLMMQAPSEVELKQLKDLGIKIENKKINFLFLNLFLHQKDLLIFPLNYF